MQVFIHRELGSFLSQTLNFFFFVFFFFFLLQQLNLLSITSKVLLIRLIFILQLIFDCAKSYLFYCLLIQEMCTSYSSSRINGHLLNTAIVPVSVHMLFDGVDTLSQ